MSAVSAHALGDRPFGLKWPFVVCTYIAYFQYQDIFARRTALKNVSSIIKSKTTFLLKSKKKTQ